MAEALSATEPGIYIVTARVAEKEERRWESRATQWLVITDLGIATFRGEDVQNLHHPYPIHSGFLRNQQNLFP